MSVLYHHETELSLLELVLVWKLPDTSQNQLLRALIQDAMDGHFDTVDEGRPSLYRYVKGRLEPLDSHTLRGEVAGPRANPAVPERLAEAIVISRGAVRAFAKRRGIPPPEFWAPEPPAARGTAAQPAAANPAPIDLEAGFKVFAEDEEKAGRRINRDTAREFAKKHGIPQKQVEELQRRLFPGEKGRPKTAQ